ncbi:MAG: hypothetical protein II852_06410 [Bacteroidales bacterium]|jgi:hypothetical protein|nr:hypothetical protein [Bacteroidales bacterium]
MKLIEFNPDKITPEEIDDYYHKTLKLIDFAFDEHLNPDYNNDFLGLTPSEIDAKKERMLNELSIESAFLLLAYIESLFRTDFILRLESGRKGAADGLTKTFKSIYEPNKKPYMYSIVDDIWANWKLFAHSKEMRDILNNLPQYFDFRNWVAHGRYWKFKESNYVRKYNYIQIKILLDNILVVFGKRLKYKNFGH